MKKKSRITAAILSAAMLAMSVQCPIFASLEDIVSVTVALPDETGIVEVAEIEDTDNAEDTEELEKSDTPEDTEEAVIMAVPEDTEETIETDAPTETDVPTETATPEETAEPVETTAPVETAAPTEDNWWGASPDGTCYDIEVSMYKWPYADPPSYSMGNGALTGDARLIKEDGEVFAEIDFQSIDMGSIIRHLIKFWYVPDQESAADQEAMSDALAAADVAEVSISAFLDNCAEECEYYYGNDGEIAYVRMPLSSEAERVICGLESDYAAMGRQLCVMSFDFDNAIEAVTGTRPERAYQVGTPVISTILSADGNSFEVYISISKTAQVSDADIYYMVTGSDDADISGIVSAANLYTGGFEVSVSEAAALGSSDGSFNIYAVGVMSGYENSVVNLKKVTFIQTADETPTPYPTAEPAETSAPEATAAPEETATPAATATPSPSSGGSGGGSGSDSDSGSNVTEITDGKYRVSIALYKSAADELSMGNAAFAGNDEAIISVSNGLATITCASNPVSIPPYYSALKELLYKNADGNWQRVTTVETQTITATDGTKEYSLNYLSIFSFRLANLEDYFVDVKINVPYTPMDEIADNGYIEARLYIDWNTLTETDDDDELTANTEAASGSTSSSGSSSSVSASADGEYTTAIDVTDRFTGIRYTAGRTAFKSGTRLCFNQSPIKTTREKAESALSDSVNSYRLLVITAKRGSIAVEPAGYVTFYVPVGNTDIDMSVIYRITDATDNSAAGKTLIDFEISADGEYFIFSLNTLGIIAICETDNPPEHKFRDPEPEPTAMPEVFSDISSAAIKEQIEAATENGWFVGVDEERFCPFDEITRAMLITALGRFDGGEASFDTENVFADVPETEYYFPYVLWAYECGITDGEYFLPDDAVTREELAVIIDKYLEYKGIELTRKSQVRLADYEEISDWARESVMKMLESGIMKRGASTSFQPKFLPKDSVSRAETVGILWTLDELIESYYDEDKSGDNSEDDLSEEKSDETETTEEPEETEDLTESEI